MIDRNTNENATAIITPAYAAWIEQHVPDSILSSAAVADGSRFVHVIRQTRLADVTRVIGLSGINWTAM